MKRPTLEKWLKRELMELSGEKSFSLRKLAALAQGQIPRLKEPLFLYCYAAGNLDKLYELLYKDDIAADYQYVEQILNRHDLRNIALSDDNSIILPAAYLKHLHSFAAAYHKPETDADSKRLRWERSKRLQLEKGVRTAQIYNALGLNPGNVNAYMKHGDVSKVSLENATAIMKYLMAL